VIAVTDAAGNVVERYAYTDYGCPTITDGAGLLVPPTTWGTAQSAIGNSYLFTGRQWDEESGLHYYRARYYDCEGGRFLQRDPLGYIEGPNFYQYADSRPMTQADANGLGCVSHLYLQPRFRNDYPSANAFFYKAFQLCIAEAGKIVQCRKPSICGRLLGLSQCCSYKAGKCGRASVKGPKPLVSVGKGITLEASVSVSSCQLKRLCQPPRCEDDICRCEYEVKFFVIKDGGLRTQLEPSPGGRKVKVSADIPCREETR
jgi:RHS repeat-associated protein